jgi:hypothetical protein
MKTIPSKRNAAKVADSTRTVKVVNALHYRLRIKAAQRNMHVQKFIGRLIDLALKAKLDEEIESDA